MDKLISDLRTQVLTSFTSDQDDAGYEYGKVNLCSVGRLPRGSVAEAILYFHQEISCWMDADGAIAWVCQVMQEMEDSGELEREYIYKCLSVCLFV
jgi:hypothetical protein